MSESNFNKIYKCAKLDIEFKNLKFSVKDADGGWRQILKSVNGKFSNGEFTAILGPSGAGKTTLLNALAGYVEDEFQGSITVNNSPRDISVFKKLSAYITQDDITQPHLTVKEAMLYSAHFKLSPGIKHHEKIALIKELISLLGLENCTETFSHNLSGGEKKRLAIGLELISNPPVIFLDEPTTGLDDFTVKQCMDLLKKISNLNRTVVLTIHQPSASLFECFDQVYVLADGFCVYNGSPNQMVPFFSTAGYTCPTNYTPSDFIIEMVHSQPDVTEKFMATIQNGKINLKESSSVESQYQAINRTNLNFDLPFYTQIYYLLSRMFLQMKRNRVALFIQFFHHLLIGFGISALFQNIGNDGSRTYVITTFCASCIISIAFTYMMIPVLLFPLEMKLLKKEYLNQWYSLKAYCCALSISSLPILVILITIFSAIAYFLTDQPQEMNRFVGFCLILVAVAYTSQGLGYWIGSLFEMVNGSVVGSGVLALYIMMSIYGMHYKSEIGPFYQVLMNLSFLRHGLVGLCGSLFLNREPLGCSEVYCHYVRSDLLLKDISIPLADYKSRFCIILIFVIIFRVMGYVSLQCRLKPQFLSKLMLRLRRN